MPVRLQTDDFDVSREVQQLRAGADSVGAVATFIGVVRGGGDATVTAMDLEHYPGMTEKALQSIVEEAKSRWPVIHDVLVIHRVGHLSIGEQIVLVAVTSPHRAEAFEACHFVVDYLKTQAPFWKKEHTPTGARWVDARTADDMAAARWNRSG